MHHKELIETEDDLLSDSKLFSNSTNLHQVWLTTTEYTGLATTELDWINISFDPALLDLLVTIGKEVLFAALRGRAGTSCIIQCWNTWANTAKPSLSSIYTMYHLKWHGWLTNNQLTTLSWSFTIH